jgi:hypothetical protein
LPSLPSLAQSPPASLPWEVLNRGASYTYKEVIPDGVEMMAEDVFALSYLPPFQMSKQQWLTYRGNSIQARVDQAVVVIIQLFQEIQIY